MDLPGEANITIRQGGTFSLTLTLTDNDETTVFNTAGYTARMQIRESKASAEITLELTDANGRILLGTQPGTWAATTAYTVGKQVIPVTPNGFLFRCITAGMSAATEPIWPTTPGNTVADGTVTWENVGAFDAAKDKYNVHLIVSATDTAALSWDEKKPQHFDFEFVSGSTVIPFIEGLVFLLKEVTR